jgi:hypothetical protein
VVAAKEAELKFQKDVKAWLARCTFPSLDGEGPKQDFDDAES